MKTISLISMCIVVSIVTGCSQKQVNAQKEDGDIRLKHGFAILVVAHDLEKGSLLKSYSLVEEEREVDNVQGTFITGGNLSQVIGKQIKRDLPKGSILILEDLEDPSEQLEEAPQLLQDISVDF